MTRMNPAVTILLSIITIGIFSLVWQWNTCASLKKLKCGDCRAIYLLLSLLLIGFIINPFIIQGKINYYREKINRTLFKL